VTLRVRVGASGLVQVTRCDPGGSVMLTSGVCP